MSLKREINKFLYRNMKVFGNAAAYRLEQLAYNIKSAKYFSDAACPYFEDRFDMYADVAKKYNLDTLPINYLEFGVWKGEAIKWWASKNTNQSSRFYGFDSFEGLPEAWGSMKEGTFSTKGALPQTDDKRISFIKGWFNKTLPGFIKENAASIAGNKVIHLDADLYSSTLYVLTRFENYFKVGDIIILDEFFGRYSQDEFRAFLDFLSLVEFEFEKIGKSKNQMAFRLVKI